MKQDTRGPVSSPVSKKQHPRYLVSVRIRKEQIMNVDLIFKVAAIGMLVAILNILLKKSDKDDYSLMVTIIGLVVVLVIVAQEVAKLFDTIKNLFGF